MDKDQYYHETRHDKYERGMRAGKKYRFEKGVRLRREKGIVGVEETSVDEAIVRIDEGLKRRWCVVMEEKKLCGCTVKLPFRSR